MSQLITGEQEMLIKGITDPVIGEIVEFIFPDDETGRTQLIISTDKGDVFADLDDVLIWNNQAA